MITIDIIYPLSYVSGAKVDAVSRSLRTKNSTTLAKSVHQHTTREIEDFIAHTVSVSCLRQFSERITWNVSTNCGGRFLFVLNPLKNHAKFMVACDVVLAIRLNTCESYVVQGRAGARLLLSQLVHIHTLYRSLPITMSSNSHGNTLVFDDDNYAALDAATYADFGTDEMDCAYEAPGMAETMPGARNLQGLSPRPTHVENGLLARAHPHLVLDSDTPVLPAAVAPQRRMSRGVYVCVALVGVVAVVGLAIAARNMQNGGDSSTAMPVPLQSDDTSSASEAQTEAVDTAALTELVQGIVNTAMQTHTPQYDASATTQLEDTIRNLTTRMAYQDEQIALQEDTIYNLTAVVQHQARQIAHHDAQLQNVTATAAHGEERTINLSTLVQSLATENLQQVETIQNLTIQLAEQATVIQELEEALRNVSDVNTVQTSALDGMQVSVVRLEGTTMAMQTALQDVAQGLTNVTDEVAVLTRTESGSGDLLGAMQAFITTAPSVAIMGGIADDFMLDWAANGVEVITGDVTIRNSLLTDITGLNALTSVGGYLRIESNAALTTISGLNALTSVGGYLYIYSNAALTSSAIDQGLARLQCAGSISTCERCPSRILSLPRC
jgi:uncharacterized coiled-coil protein SlyX